MTAPKGGLVAKPRKVHPKYIYPTFWHEKRTMPRKSLTARLILDGFGLPVTFPPEMIPDAARQFVVDAIKGMTVADLLQMAQARGFNPLWKPLRHMVDGEVFGLGLDVSGM